MAGEPPVLRHAHRMALLPNDLPEFRRFVADVTTIQEDLPETIRRKASISSGGEHAWRQATVEDTIRAACEAGLACLGGQVQFQLPDGTCEAYWVKYDPQQRLVGESWPDYVARSADETLHAFHRVCRETDFRFVASEFEFLRTRMDREGYDPLADLWFVLYFAN